jgi:hypothetical protein
MKRLRLVKVVVQAHYVLDDGETLTEQVAEPIAVAAAEWPDFPARLEVDRVALEQTLVAPESTNGAVPDR